MYDVIKSSNNPLTAKVVFQNITLQPQYIHLIASDYNKPFTIYTERKVTLSPQQQRVIDMSFPVSPEFLEIYTYNMLTHAGSHITQKQAAKQIDYTYNAQVMQTLKSVKDCDVWMDAETDQITKFAEWFAINAGLLSCYSYNENHELQPYSLYRSSNGKYIIRYMPFLVLPEPYTDNIIKVSSPARVGHDTGIVEVSKEHFLKYSIPKRFIILMHEFMHKYGNKKQLGEDIDKEEGADFLALYIYLGKGYPRIDAKDVFLKIFYGNPTPENEKRKNMIVNFINDFDSGKINNLINCKTK